MKVAWSYTFLWFINRKNIANICDTNIYKRKYFVQQRVGRNEVVSAAI